MNALETAMLLDTMAAEAKIAAIISPYLSDQALWQQLEKALITARGPALALALKEQQ